MKVSKYSGWLVRVNSLIVCDISEFNKNPIIIKSDHPYITMWYKLKLPYDWDYCVDCWTKRNYKKVLAQIADISLLSNKREGMILLILFKIICISESK